VVEGVAIRTLEEGLACRRKATRTTFHHVTAPREFSASLKIRLRLIMSNQTADGGDQLSNKKAPPLARGRLRGVLMRAHRVLPSVSPNTERSGLGGDWSAEARAPEPPSSLGGSEGRVAKFFLT
jgi:hypothetical protein